MSQRMAALLLVLGVAIVAAGCGSNGDQTSGTPPPASLTPPGSQGWPAVSPVAPGLSLGGEEVENLGGSAVLRVTWADGTVYEETLPTLMLRTVGRPDAPQGRRVVAGWLGGDRWQVTILLRTTDRSTDPATVIDLRAELYFDGASGTFEPANGRAYFALTGSDPCATEEPPADLCPLDKAISPE
jgi:hypothetical protein